MNKLDKLGVEEIRSRWTIAKHRAGLDAFTFFMDPRDYRPVPTDWIPRLIPEEHWDIIAAGVAQRLKAINRFLLDLYCGEQTVVPPDVIYSSQCFCPEFQGVHPAKDVFVHIYGTDLVHMGDGNYVVLEDNLRIPSGIAYQMKAVNLGLQVLPEVAENYKIVPYDIVSAGLAIQKGDDSQTFQEILGTEAAARGIIMEDDSDVVRALVKEHSTSSIYHSLYTARGNATQVGSVELIQAISEIVKALGRRLFPERTPRAQYRA